MTTVHISDIRAYKSCPRLAYFSSPLWKGLGPLEVYGPFYIGRLVHAALEYYYAKKGKLSFRAATTMAVETEAESATGLPLDQALWVLEGYTETARSILHWYYRWIKSEDHRNHPWGDPSLEFLEQEPTFEVSLPYTSMTGRCLGGRFDGLVRRRDDGSLWLFETKTTVSIQNLQKSLRFDEQAGAYIYAAQQILGEHVEGVIYNILRKKAPTMPPVLKSGKLSQNKSLDTTVERYLDAAYAAHPHDSDEEIRERYADMLAHLEAKGNTFFSRTIVRRTPYEIRKSARELSKVATRMANEEMFAPSPDFIKCNRCLFQNPCLAASRGEAYDFGNAYTPRTDRSLRPTEIYGIYFIPVSEEKVTVWWDGVRLLDAPTMKDAVTIAASPSFRRQGREGFPPSKDIKRKAKELNVWPKP